MRCATGCRRWVWRAGKCSLKHGCPHGIQSLALGFVSRARITQIMNLLNLAPEIQEYLLLLPLPEGGSPLAESGIWALCAVTEWERQRAASRSVSNTA